MAIPLLFIQMLSVLYGSSTCTLDNADHLRQRSLNQIQHLERVVHFTATINASRRKTKNVKNGTLGLFGPLPSLLGVRALQMQIRNKRIHLVDFNSSSWQAMRAN